MRKKEEVVKRMITQIEIARELGLSYQCIHQWVTRGKISSIQIIKGGHRYIPRSIYEAWKKENVLHLPTDYPDKG